MKLKLIHVVMLLWLGTTPAVQAQTFDKLWEQVEQAERKSLPETIIKITDEIYQKGEKEKNSPQMLKAYLWQMRYRNKLTPDSHYTTLKEMEQWAKQSGKPIDRAILHSLIAGIYADYASKNQWQIRQRAEIAGQEPAEDIREWTANMFREKVRTNAKEALADSALLLKTSSETYVPFIELGEASEYYHHDMYHLLASRSIEALQQIRRLRSKDNDLPSPPVEQDITTIYENMISAYRTSGPKEGYILTTLNFLDWKYKPENLYQPFLPKTGLQESESDTDPYIIALNELKKQSNSIPVCAEVYLTQARYAVQKEQQVNALQLCDEAIRLYPDYKRINALKNLREDILEPFLNVDAPVMAFPGEKIKLRVSHKNLDGFTLYLFQAKKVVKRQHYPLLRSKDYQLQDTVFTINVPKAGTYLMRIVPDNQTKNNSENLLNVTHFKVLTRRLPEGQYEAVTLDAQTGHPIPNAKVVFYNDIHKTLQEFTTDEDGKAVFPWNSEFRYLKATKGTDTVMPLMTIFGGNYRYHESGGETSEEIRLLTDRSLYRPGQTVYVKGIAYQQNPDTAHVIADKEYTVTLLDANNQEVGQKEVRTNDFGSFTTDFILPSACLNGMFVLKAGKGRRDIRVEEYKRPTFDITFKKQDESYKLGDEIQVKGKIQSYNGIIQQGLPVKYKVTRTVYIKWQSAETLLASGEVVANEKGEFTIPVRLEENEMYKNNKIAYYDYSIETTVTNAAGETQSSTNVIPATSCSMVLQAKLNEKNSKDKPILVEIMLQNLNKHLIEAKGTYRLFHAKNKELKEVKGEPVETGTFTANRELTFDWKHLPSGPYILKLEAKDNRGNEVTAETGTIIFSTTDTRPPVESPVWFYEENTEFDAIHPAKFYFGTSEKDVYVMMNIFCGDRLLDRKKMYISDTIVPFDYPYEKSYGNGLSINFCMVRNGETYQEQTRLKKRLPEKTLTMKWKVFRDKLRPGQEEEWKLTIKTPQGQAADAEMLATMYDASLDKIWNRPQIFRYFYIQPISYSNWMSGYPRNHSFNYSQKDKYPKVPIMEYDHFVKPSISKLGEHSALDEVVVVGFGAQKKNTLVGAVTTIGTDNAESMMRNKLNAQEDELFEEEKEEHILAEVPADLRTNLNETAFFYPQLRTNEQGEIVFSFTMPESLTRWNFCGYSHTKGMSMGTLDSTATTSKEFMLTPNLPRFVRVGDQTSIAASISNMTGKSQSGTVSMILFDPITEKVISTQIQKFTVTSGETIGVNFMFTASDKYEALGCRLIADNETFSDGEQQLLPVLSNKEHLVETLPMPVRGEETRTFSLDKLFNRHSSTATDRKLTIEYTGNPAWYAIQALPSLSIPVNNNAISWATAYYANTLAAFIMNSQPRIKAVFDSWKLQGGTKETFLSNLQKNQEVKNILLSESPWVLEAQTEEQQKERIATLFDLNTISSNSIAALTRLQELQKADGAWSWCKGMSSSHYVTLYIAGLNARLAMLTGKELNGVASILQQNAFAYLHQSALKEYKETLKAQKEGKKFTGVSESILQYLYLIAISGEEIPADNQDAYTYYLSKISEMLQSPSMDTKAIVAIVLDKAGRKKEAQEFTASLKEHLTKTDEQGMFFAFNENPYTWGGMRMQAHVAVMEAVELIDGNSETIEEMKLWLLKQKQTQQWNSPVATADAIYALLMKGTNLLDNQESVRIRIAKEILETTAPDKTGVPGLSYIKRSFTQKEVVNARKIKVEKKGPGIAWGAVYAEYESPVSDMKQQGGELNVQKQLYVERMVDHVFQLQPITGETVLQVGDKVVSRLSIRTDRSMDFVQLKDQRGACFEPIGSISGYRWNNGFGYYVDIKEASTNFFFDHLGKGVYILEYSYRVSRAGTYETGLATIQCAYAPEYASHTDSKTVVVK